MNILAYKDYTITNLLMEDIFFKPLIDRFLYKCLIALIFFILGDTLFIINCECSKIIAYVWGKRNLRTAKKLRKQLKKRDITYDSIATDDWKSFKTTFKEDKHLIGKTYTVGIEGNNCKIRHRIKRTFRRTCCFSKKLSNHFKAFSLAFFYINYGHT